MVYRALRAALEELCDETLFVTAKEGKLAKREGLVADRAE